MTVSIASLTFDCADALKVGSFWSAALGRPLDPKVAKNRLHLDVMTADPQAEVDRLVDLGATRVGYVDEYGYTRTVMTGPEGNEFCVAKAV